MRTIKDRERWNEDPKGSDRGLFRDDVSSPREKKMEEGNVTRGRGLKSVENFFWNSFTYVSTVRQIVMQLQMRILRNVVRDGSFTGAAVVNVENFRERNAIVVLARCCDSRATLGVS